MLDTSLVGVLYRQVFMFSITINLVLLTSLYNLLSNCIMFVEVQPISSTRTKQEGSFLDHSFFAIDASLINLTDIIPSIIITIIIAIQMID